MVGRVNEVGASGRKVEVNNSGVMTIGKEEGRFFDGIVADKEETVGFGDFLVNIISTGESCST